MHCNVLFLFRWSLWTSLLTLSFHVLCCIPIHRVPKLARPHEHIVVMTLPKTAVLGAVGNNSMYRQQTYSYIACWNIFPVADEMSKLHHSEVRRTANFGTLHLLFLISSVNVPNKFVLILNHVVWGCWEVNIYLLMVKCAPKFDTYVPIQKSLWKDYYISCKCHETDNITQSKHKICKFKMEIECSSHDKVELTATEVQNENCIAQCWYNINT